MHVAPLFMLSNYALKPCISCTLSTPLLKLFNEIIFSGNPKCENANQFVYILHRILYNQLGINPISLLGVMI